MSTANGTNTATTATALATAQQSAQLSNHVESKTSRSQEVRELITSKYADKITALLPANHNKLQFLAGIATAVQKNPDLIECTTASLLSAAMMCASYGMAPNTPLGEAWIIPYANKNTGTLEATFQLGYQGILRMVYETPYVAKVDARCVYEGDDFDYQYGTNEFLHHKPKQTGARRELTHVWAMIYLKSGAIKFEVLERFQVDERRKRSKSPNRGPWVTDYERMAMRTALLDVCKYIPKSNKLAAVEQAEAEQRIIESAEQPQIEDASYTVNDTNEAQ